MIYSVVPEELAPELYARLVEYYKDDPNVTVIVDRRKSSRRGPGDPPPADEQRAMRDRRRRSIPGEFPPLDPAA